MQNMQYFRVRMVYEYYLGVQIMSILGVILFFNYFLRIGQAYYIGFMILYIIYVLAKAVHFIYKVYFRGDEEEYLPVMATTFADGLLLSVFLYFARDYFHFLSALFFIYLVLLSILNHKRPVACSTFTVICYASLVTLLDYKQLASFQVLTHVGLLYLMAYVMSSVIGEITKLENRMCYMYEDLEHKNFILSEMVSKDFLTNLYNHKTFYTYYKELVEYSSKSNIAFSLALLDIDNFKKINDNYGHLAGDSILKEVAAIILSHIDQKDIAARYGGEEFALLLPGAAPESGVEICERIRTDIEQHSFDLENRTIQVTISGGVATAQFVTPHCKQNIFLELVDQLLYKAKSQGKNRIIASPEPMVIQE
ncbi:MAG: diguanylate cyclase [Paenibacillaceae bacterium]|jgi:diguanylate cyclase (GGDEF)-like protein|nr:diguanylate cyclase [Paenibacillaceae bacterium]